MSGFSLVMLAINDLLVHFGAVVLSQWSSRTPLLMGYGADLRLPPLLFGHLGFSSLESMCD